MGEKRWCVAGDEGGDLRALGTWGKYCICKAINAGLELQYRAAVSLYWDSQIIKAIHKQLLVTFAGFIVCDREDFVLQTRWFLYDTIRKHCFSH